MKSLDQYFNLSYFRTITAGISMLLLIGVTACDNQATRTSSGTGTMEVLLHDNPGAYQELWIDVQRVEVNNQTDADTGWVVINEPGERFNLLELVNGAHAVLGEAELEEGTYHQIRLILGDENTIVVNDSTYNLQTPSAQQSGLKLNIDAEIREGFTYILALDFDVNRSIVRKGGPQGQHAQPYLLKPVIRAYATAETGTISGVVEPAESNSWIYAIAGDDTLSSSRTEDNTGEFRLLGLPADIYDVSIDPDNEEFEIMTISDVEVIAGEDTDIGTIEL